MKRRLLNLLTALSLLLCVLVTPSWVRSYRGTGRLEFVRRGVRWEAVSRKGMLVLSDRPQKDLDDATGESASRKWLEEDRRMGAQWAELLRRNGEGWRLSPESLAFLERRGRTADANRAEWDNVRAKLGLPERYHSVPHALPAAAAAVTPAVWLTLAVSAHLRRRRRVAANHCPA